MAGIKDKVVTVESLGVLHERNEDTYATKVNPTFSGEMTMNGDANFSNGIMIGSNVKLVPTENSLEIVFLN